MRDDRLSITARAAGFAMACDETAGGPASKTKAPPPPAVQVARTKAVPPSQAITTRMPTALAKAASGWSPVGWTFWKTA